MVIFRVFFKATELQKRGITEQAAVYVREFFSEPAGEIIGYTGNSETAGKILRVLKSRYENKGRLRDIKNELPRYALDYPI